MIKVHSLRPLLAASSVLALLTGCSTIEGWFPDKHKQYQYSTEIAALEIPPDLSSSTIDGASGGSRPSWESPSSADDSAEAVSSDREATPAPGAEMSPEDAKAMRAGKDHPKPVLAESSSDVPLIEVQAPFDITWAEVNKALGRQKLEIIDQNRSDGLYFVHYAKNQKPYEDKGFFGDVAEMFNGSPGGTQEYRIKLEEKSGVTSIYVQDSEGKPQRDGPGLDLLKQLNETLQNTALGGKGEKPAP
jgi:outer membrane protein assembly factor BamC